MALRMINVMGFADSGSMKINFKEILDNAIIDIKSEPDPLISVIIPTYGRSEFIEPLINSFNKSINNLSPKEKITFTIVENSESSEHREICNKLGVNYIWINKETKEPFNKCLAMNIGAILVKGNSYMFHDLDCLVQSSFFPNLIENINNKESHAIQTFTGRRVLYLNKNLTKHAIDGILNVDSLKKTQIGVTLPNVAGAPGGSIWIKKKLFLKIGGYDQNLFSGYSYEDSFFWSKVNAISKMDICDTPINEIFHMDHPSVARSNPELSKQKEIHDVFINSTNEEKIDFINQQNKKILEFYV